MNNFEKFMLALVLLLLGFIGLGMSLCGAFFTFTGMKEAGILFISLPSAVGGFLLLNAVVKGLRKLLGKQNVSATDEGQ